MFQSSWWARLQQVASIYKVATLPLALVGTGVTGARFYNSWNPEGYARWYLWSISAGRFKEPAYAGPWVANKSMTQIVRQALKERKNFELMTLISGLEMSGKTSAVLKECHDQGKVGFFIDLGFYMGKTNDEKKIEEFVVGSLISNQTATFHSWLQHMKWLFFPQPQPDAVWKGLRGAFKAHPQELVLVVDEMQILANEVMQQRHRQHRGILNEFCALSLWGNVVLVASEFFVAEYFKLMTHVTEHMRYSPAPTSEEMQPHVKERFEADFGEEGVAQILRSLDGSFLLLRRLDQNRAVGIEGVKKWHKEQLTYSLELTEGGMKKGEEKATKTGEAMLAAAKMAFGLPVEALHKNTLELAQVGGAKIETTDDGLQASWASPLTGEVMKELVCDKGVATIMKKRVPAETCKKFEQVIKGRCPTVKQ
ncbi:unnamed protein product [Effrenium voratum]|uniref:Uncharacterized protein n=1 Tax=Effrenium voratum TaxID=2562239 RepID=A0AA36N4F2_9DINO|nr:unnamed protein product [Effrenium voratum]